MYHLCGHLTRSQHSLDGRSSMPEANDYPR
jgi:hypothetical protein